MDMICTIGIFDEDGEQSLQVEHTTDGDVWVCRYGERTMNLSYGECRALVRALTVIMSEPDLGVDFPVGLTRGKCDDKI
jgi:hypothetical protein